MQTHFTADQLADPLIAEADGILRNCVHCGFCIATCPTFIVTGDERDSPRGRIWMLREVLESPETITTDTAYHIDRCLGCLSCTTTCPSGVDYPHLLDIGREKLNEMVPRTFTDRVMRQMLGMIIPHSGRFRAMIQLAWVGRLFSWAMPTAMRAALTKIPAQLKQLDPIGGKNAIFPANTKQVKRVALLAGCAQRALAPEINASTVRVLNRLGVEVVVRAEAHCCGALAHHIGEATRAHDAIRAALLAWHDEIRTGGLDAIVVNASGCGTMVKDYGHMMKDDPELAPIAKMVSDACVDVSELIDKLDLESILLPAPVEGRPKVAYHSACSLQHGQKIHDLPLRLLRQAGFDVVQPLNGHLCCGSAGVYNLLQPKMADELKARKLESLDKTGAQFVAAGNIGCIMQLDRDDLPVWHTVQFIDWASGGPRPH